MSKYGNIRGGKRDDLPGVIVKSAWEANVARVLKHLQFVGNIILWDKEKWVHYFPGERKTHNSAVRLDFFVVWGKSLKPRYRWYEVKGFLARGGRLDQIDLSQLAGRDDDSRIKLERFRTHYPQQAKQVYLIGQREYKWLEKHYSWLPNWEGQTKKVPTKKTPATRIRKAKAA